MKKAVVTGGAGFIGSHLTRELAKLGYSVIVIDDLSSGKKENIGDLLKSNYTNNVQLVQDCITNLPLLRTLFSGIDFVFHLAAIASVPFSINNPLEVNRINLTGTLNVLEAARLSNVKKVVFISSSAVYGDTHVLPQREESPPAPQSPYAVTKLGGEQYCRVFRGAYKLATVCLRYFNVYGPRQDPNSQYAAVIPKFITMAQEDKAPVIFGTGEQTRDFVFVRDAVKAAVLAAESDASGVYNIASGRAVTINDLTRMILKMSGKDLKPVHMDTRSGDIVHSIADISRAKTFGYRPMFDLESGLRETFDYYSRLASRYSIVS